MNKDEIVLILESGPSSVERGFFSFVIQFVSVHRHYFTQNIDYKIYFDLRNSAYSDYTGNHWNIFFEQDNLPIGTRTFWGDSGNVYGYTFDFNDIEERKIAKKIIDKHLILKPQINEKIQSHFNEFFVGKKILGVHKRGTDINMHHENPHIDEYFKIIDNIYKDYDAIYLACDDQVGIDLFKKRYDNIINLSYSTTSQDVDLPNFKTDMSDRHKMAEDVIIDGYLLSKCDLLIKMNSNLSNFSLLLEPSLDFVMV
jgi:hypothetical protein